MTIGITGGIGAGKSLISRILETLSYPVFNSDKEAKVLVESNPVIKQKIIQLLGKDAYENGLYNRSYVATIVFHNENKLKQLNDIIHPTVRQLFIDFVASQSSSLIFNEAAILFETGAYKSFDKTILVCAKEDVRLKRIISRDGANEKDVLTRFAQQWRDNEKIPLADFVIENNDEKSVLLQLNSILTELI